MKRNSDGHRALPHFYILETKEKELESLVYGHQWQLTVLLSPVRSYSREEVFKREEVSACLLGTEFAMLSQKRILRHIEVLPKKVY
jgi:hypothetical protein